MLQPKPASASFENTKTRILRGFTLDEKIIPEVLNERDYLGDSLLHHAVRYGNIRAVDQLISHGADVNAQNSFGIAAINHCFSIEVAQLLINNGADINVTDDEGESILTKAYFMEKLDLVKFLLANNADANNLKEHFDLPRDWTNEQIIEDMVNDLRGTHGEGSGDQCLMM